MDAVKERLAAITTANGYQTNLGARQHEWLSRKLNPDELPAHVVRDGEAKPVFEEGGRDASQFKWRLPFTVDLIFPEEGATVEQARLGIADVYQAISVDDTWKVATEDDGEEELAARTVPVSDRVMSDKEGNFLGGARIEFFIEYYLDRWSTD